ncbi:50S ribosomal protein L11 methyltransferase [candidate division KSB1 bacterium]
MAENFRKNKFWYEIKIQCRPDEQDILCYWLTEFGSEGTDIRENCIITYFDSRNWDDNLRNDLCKKITELYENKHLSDTYDIEVTKISDENWAENWKEHFKRIQTGQKLVIVPPWEKDFNDKSRINIVIEPGMAFGTGNHPSTELALVLLERYTEPGSKVFDFGSGTGILSITAIKLGAAGAEGTDIDNEAIIASEYNSKKNNVDKYTHFSDIDISNYQSGYYDIVAANINRRTIIEHSKGLTRLLKQNGKLILSGIEVTDTVHIIEEFSTMDFVVVEQITKSEWTAIVLTK